MTTTGALTASGSANMAGLSTFTRSDGTKQAAYDGHALYYFEGDSGPVRSPGRGSTPSAPVELVDPAGTAITAAVTVSSGATPSAPASPASGGGGY